MSFLEEIGEMLITPVLDITEWWLARTHREAWDRHVGKLLPLQWACANSTCRTGRSYGAV